MMETRGNAALVTLSVPPAVKDVVVDWLLARVGDAGYTSFSAYGHGAGHDDLSPAEQVSGRQNRQMFQIKVSRDRVEAFLEDASELLGGAGVHYWVVPLLASGRLSTASK